MMNMTKKMVLKSLCSVFSCLVLAACGSTTPQERIQANPALYNALPARQQALVQQGQICRGMDRNAVLLAWGQPDSRANGQTRDGAAWERWEYNTLEPVTTVHSGFGGWYGPYGPYGWRPYGGSGIDTTYIPRCMAAVEFVNGTVERWMHNGR